MPPTKKSKKSVKELSSHVHKKAKRKMLIYRTLLKKTKQGQRKHSIPATLRLILN